MYSLIEDVIQTGPTTRQSIYQAFADYFGSIDFTKIEEFQNRFSVYMVLIASQLGLTQKYLLAFVPRDFNPVGTKKLLSELHWVCFQTQMFSKTYTLLSPQKYGGKKVPLLETEIVNQNVKDKFIYQATGLPLQVELIPKKDNRYPSYAEKGTIRIALETYATSITFTG